jgi:c-di-GMP-binding flagellar brake protein YcgR
VVQTVQADGPATIVVVADGAWDRVQRRTAVRLPVAIRPRRVARLKDGPHGKEGDALRSAIANISATGLQLRSLDPSSMGEAFEASFALPGEERELNVQVVVRRIRQIQQVPHAVWELGCQFQNLREALEDHIVQYIFAQQRAQARVQRAR